MIQRIIIFCICSFVFFSNSNAQIDTSFWFVAPEIWQGHDDRPIYLRFTTFDEPATIVIEQPANNNFPIQTLSLTANDAQSIDLTDWIDIIENKPVNQILNYGLHITSSSRITAYYEEASLDNPDVFSLKGKNALGTEFYTPFQNLLNSNYSESKAAIDIIATQDNTTIEITPTTNLIDHPANTSFSINLNKGQTYSLRAESTLSYLRPSGTHISSDKPISVTISDDSVLGSPYYSGTAFDLLGDQLIPVSKMGFEYIAVKGELSLDDKIYVTASDDNTEIYVEENIVAIINSGETYEISLNSNSIYFRATKPVVALHMTGYGSELCSAVLPPINCTGSQNVSFIRSEDNPNFKLNIIVKSGAENNFLFNGSPNIINGSDFNVVPNTNGEWMYASISDPEYVDILQNSNITNTSDYFHVGIIMGRYSSSRYGFFSNFNEYEHAISSISETYCDGDSLLLVGESIPNVDYIWEGPNGFTATGNNYLISAIQLEDSGTYVLNGELGNCQVRSDSINISVLSYDDASFVLSDFCQGSNNSATILGEQDGHFSLINSLDGTTLDSLTGALSNTTVGFEYEIVYQTHGTCPSSSIETVSVLGYEDATFMVENVCFGDSNLVIVSGNEGGIFSLVNNTSETYIDSNTGHLFNTIANTTYTIEYNTIGSDTECSNSSQQNIEVYALPTNPSVIPLLEYCTGDSIPPASILSPQPNSTFNWYSNEDLIELLSSSVAYQIPDSIGTTSVYVIEITENNCQSEASTITQIIKPVPEINAGSDIDICQGDTIELDLSGGINYSWNQLIAENTPISIESGEYELIVTGENALGCSNNDTIILNILPTPNPNIGNDTEVCGLQHTLSAEYNGNSGYWSGHNANILDTTSHVTTVVNDSYGQNTFTWYEVNSYGCESSASVNINFTSETLTEIIFDTLFSCENVSAIIEVISNDNDLLSWSSTGSGNFDYSNLPYVQYNHSNEDLESGEVEIFLESQLGNCYNYDTVKLFFYRKPELEFINDSYLCGDENQTSMDLNFSGTYPYRFDLLKNNTFVESYNFDSYLNDEFLTLDLGTYQIVNFYDSLCDGNDSEKFNVSAKEHPVADFTLYPRETSISEPTIHVNEQSLFANHYKWSFGDSSEFFYGESVSYDYLQAGNFEIILYVEDDYGCMDSISKTVIIHPNYDLYIPNSFTPDGDEVNDTFICKGYGINDFIMSIYNRWGEVIYSTNNLNQGWDGDRVPNGVYIYKIRVLDFLGKSYLYEGEVTLVR